MITDSFDREFMGITGPLFITMDMDIHLMEHTLHLVPTMGHDGQLYGPQHYQYGAPYYQPPTTPNGPYAPAPTSKGDVSTSVAADQVPLPVETGNGNSNGGVNGSNGSATLKPGSQNGSLTSNGSFGRGVMPGGVPTAGYQDPRLGFDGMRSPIPWLDGPIFSDGQPRPATSTVSSAISNGPSGRNQSLRPPPHLMVVNFQFILPLCPLPIHFCFDNCNPVFVVEVSCVH